MMARPLDLVLLEPEYDTSDTGTQDTTARRHGRGPWLWFHPGSSASPTRGRGGGGGLGEAYRPGLVARPASKQIGSIHILYE